MHTDCSTVLEVHTRVVEEKEPHMDDGGYLWMRRSCPSSRTDCERQRPFLIEMLSTLGENDNAKKEMDIVGGE